jgi:hypothetical protein
LNCCFSDLLQRFRVVPGLRQGLSYFLGALHARLPHLLDDLLGHLWRWVLRKLLRHLQALATASLFPAALRHLWSAAHHPAKQAALLLLLWLL